MAGIQRFMRDHGYVGAVLTVAAATAFFVPLRHYVDFTHLAWLYLGVVGLMAWLSGTGPALLAAGMSFAAGAYFTPPVGALAIAKPYDVIQLVIFFLGAVAVGALTSHTRTREAAALEAEREATALARLAGEMARSRDVSSIVASAASCLAEQPEVRRVVVWTIGDEGLVPTGRGANAIRTGERVIAERVFDTTVAVNLPSLARSTERLGSRWPAVDPEPTPGGVGTFVPLVSTVGVEGVLQVVGAGESLGATTSSLAVSVAHLLADFFATERAAEKATRNQGAQEAARVKAVIVSAVSHELKTPLAAALAGVTDLMAEDVSRDPEQVRLELAEIAEDLQRLQVAIRDLLDLSRLQAEEWMPHPELYEAGEILGDVVAAAPGALRDRLVFRVKAHPVPEVYADFTQVSRALRAVLDNAVSYSPTGSPIFLGAERRDERTAIWIEDRGTGVSDAEKPFVFDRAYRGEAGVRRPGSTGLGLTIARDLVEANAGSLRVEDAVPRGTRIVVELPAAPAGEGGQ